MPSDNLLAELYESCIEKRWNERKGPDFYKPLLCDEREIEISEGILPQSHLIKKSNSSSSMVYYYTADLSERQAIAEEEILSVKIFDEALSGKGISYCADVNGIDNSSSFSFDIVTSSRDISSFSLTSNPQNENETVPSSEGYIKKSERCSERQTLTNDDYIERKRNQAETPASKDQGNFSPSRYQENGQKRNQKLDKFDRKDMGRGQLSADEFLEHYQQRKREQSKSPEQVNKERLVAVAGAVALIASIAATASKTSKTTVDQPKPSFKAKKYAKGSKTIDKDQLANVDEQGSELVVRQPESGRYTYLETGDGVVPADITSRLFEMGGNPDEWFNKQLAKHVALSNVQNHTVGGAVSVGDIYIQNPVGNTNELAKEIVLKLPNALLQYQSKR